MSDEDIKEKITSKKRDLSREEELERGKVWNITTQRYRSKLTTEQTYKSGLLYLASLNCYLDYSKIKTRKGYNGYNNRRSNHCAGCNCNQSCNHNQRSQNRSNSDGRRSSRGNTPCPHESIQSMQDSINLIMDESCNLLDLQDIYKDSLNF